MNRDIGAMIDEMFDGKSSKEGKSFHYRGRRARPSAEEAEAMRAAAREESIDYMDYNSTNVRFLFPTPKILFYFFLILNFIFFLGFLTREFRVITMKTKCLWANHVMNLLSVRRMKIVPILRDIAALVAAIWSKHKSITKYDSYLFRHFSLSFTICG